MDNFDMKGPGFSTAFGEALQKGKTVDCAFGCETLRVWLQNQRGFADEDVVCFTVGRSFSLKKGTYDSGMFLVCEMTVLPKGDGCSTFSIPTTHYHTYINAHRILYLHMYLSCLHNHTFSQVNQTF